MARKKQTEVKAEQPAELPAETTAVATVEQKPEAPTVQQNGTRRPDVSWALNSDRTTRVEVSAWLNRYTNQQGEEYEQVTFTVTRNYRDQNDQWCRGGSWRTHDIPVLLFLLTKGHAWALDRRTHDSSVGL